MKKIVKILGIFFISLLFLGIILLWSLPKPPLLEGVGFSKVVYDEHQTLLRLTLSGDEKYRLFVPLSAIALPLRQAALLQEDQYFYWHFGINPLAVGKALWQTYILHSRRMGASTITMQLVRIRYGIYTKNWFGKLQQIIKALQIEMHYSKDQILEAYLNLAPYGGEY